MSIFDKIKDPKHSLDDVVKYIKENPQCVQEQLYQQTPLHFAITEDKPEIVEVLIRAKANTDTPDDHGRTPLWFAASVGDIKIVKMLLPHKPSPFPSCCTCKLTILHIAVKNRHHDIVQLFLETFYYLKKEKFLDAIDAKGETPVFKAAINNDLKMVDILIADGASITRPRKDGKTLQALSDDGKFDAGMQKIFCGKLPPETLAETDNGGKGNKNNIHIDVISERGSNHDLSKPFLACLVNHVRDRKLEAFFSGDEERKLVQCLHKYADQAETLSKGLQVDDVRMDRLAPLTLYDLAILIDDSRSMPDADGGKGIDALRGFIVAITHIYSYSCNSGNGKVLGIRFINSDSGEDNVDQAGARKLLEQHEYSGPTKIGTQLKNKILVPLVTEDMKRPLIVIIITSSPATGENREALPRVLTDCLEKTKSFVGGEFSVSFQFCRIGDNMLASFMLEDLMADPKLFPHVDCQLEDVHINRSGNVKNNNELDKITGLILGGINRKGIYNK